MRIAYVVQNIELNSGIYNKIADQIDVWTQMGMEVNLFNITRTRWQRYRGALAIPFGAGKSGCNAVWEKAVEDWQPDLVYLRYGLAYPEIQAIMGRYPTVAEINSDDLTEYKLSSHLVHWLNRLTRSRFLDKADGLVFVTYELRDSESFASYRKPSAVVPNGIDLNKYKVLPLPAHRETVLSFMGSPDQPWHGVDKIIVLAKMMPGWKFNIIGISGDLFSPLPANITVHGYLNREQYLPILEQSNIGIGTLALHRKNMNEACAIKVREYLAYGLPVIIGHPDSDFLDGNHPFICQISNSETNVVDEISKIKSFVDEVRLCRVNHSEIANLDTGVKEKIRLAFMADVLQKTVKKEL